MLRFRKCSPGCGAAFEKLVYFHYSWEVLRLRSSNLSLNAIAVAWEETERMRPGRCTPSCSRSAGSLF